MPRFADEPSDNLQNPRARDGAAENEAVEKDAPRKPRRRASNLLVLGGVGLAAAATVLAARAVADALSADPEDRPQRRPRATGPRETLPPRFADMDEADRRAVRARARADIADYEERAARIREAAMRERREKERLARRRHRTRRRQGFFDDFSGNAVKLATNITTLIAAANAAVDGFQQVSGRTGGIMRDFTEAADRLRGFFDPGKDSPADKPAQSQTSHRTATQTAEAPAQGDDTTSRHDRTHNL